MSKIEAVSGWLLRCTLSALVGLSGATVAAPSLIEGGISLSQTRVIFLSGDRAQIVKVKNSGQDQFLIQSRIEMGSTATSSAPLVVTPPLFRLQPDSEQQLRIIFQGAELPADRESLFFLSVMAIPSRPAMDAEASKVSMGIRFRLKLFYRPEALGAAPRVCSLRVSRQPDGVLVENPTPFYQTFSHLSLNNRPVNLDIQTSMLEPYGSQHYRVSGRVRDAEWQTIDDYGVQTKACHQKLSFSEDATS